MDGTIVDVSATVECLNLCLCAEVFHKLCTAEAARKPITTRRPKMLRSLRRTLDKIRLSRFPKLGTLRFDHVDLLLLEARNLAREEHRLSGLYAVCQQKGKDLSIQHCFSIWTNEQQTISHRPHKPSF